MRGMTGGIIHLTASSFCESVGLSFRALITESNGQRAFEAEQFTQ
jgi:hypothetical protein